MVITYEGGEFIKIQYGDTVLAFNPVSKDSKLKGARFGADIVFSSLNHPEFNGLDTVSFGEKKPFAVTGPGEYEIKGIFIRGFATPSAYGGENKTNTIYFVSLEGANILYLGALGSKELATDIMETIEDIDILFVPIGGNGVLDAASAYKLAVNIEPKIIIPMHYGNIGAKDALRVFLKEGGEENGEVADKLTIKKKDIEGRNGDIVILKPQIE